MIVYDRSPIRDIVVYIDMRSMEEKKFVSGWMKRHVGERDSHGAR